MNHPGPIAAAFLAASLRIATPMLLAAMGAILAERSGVFAVGLEGMMLAGAFAAAAVTQNTGSIALGLLASLVGGASTGLVVVVVALRCRADQMVTGLAANTLAAGMTSFLLRVLFPGRIIRVPLLQPWPVPGLAQIPGLGPLLFNQPPLTYLALLGCVPASWFLMRTDAGLRLRAAGENPEAAYASGASPERDRMLATLAGAALAGLGGAVLVVQQVGTFTDAMTAGRGFLALAAVIVGRWNPFATAVACIFFGGAEALEIRAQGFGLALNSYEVEMLPYLFAILILAAAGRSARMPAALGRAWRPGYDLH